jgi:hypothetical protein
LSTDKSNIKQKENKNMKKAKFEREEYGYGYDISANDLNIIGQNKSAKSNKDSKANHPISNDKK